MAELPPLTILLGPQTELGLTLNSLVRTERASFAEHGLTAWPNRIATRLLREGVKGTDPIAERRTAFQAAIAPIGPPVFLSAVNYFGAPTSAFQKAELFPDVEALLLGMAELVAGSSPRLVVTLDAVHRFFLDAASEALQRRVSGTAWEVLYELSWADLLTEIVAALPGCKVLVLTPHAAAVQSPDVLTSLFGPAANTLEDPWALARICLTLTGQAALDNLLTVGPVGPERVEELLAAFPVVPEPAVVQEKLGMDTLTTTLIEQRFREDLRGIEVMDRVQVL